MFCKGVTSEGSCGRRFFARDPEFLNRDKTWMKLYVKFKHLPNEIMFTACIDSDTPYVS